MSLLWGQLALLSLLMDQNCWSCFPGCFLRLYLIARSFFSILCVPLHTCSGSQATAELSSRLL